LKQRTRFFTEKAISRFTEGFENPAIRPPSPQILKSLYGLKQPSRIWFLDVTIYVDDILFVGPQISATVLPKPTIPNHEPRPNGTFSAIKSGTPTKWHIAQNGAALSARIFQFPTSTHLDHSFVSLRPSSLSAQMSPSLRILV